MPGRFLIYGATGFTGRLMARRAKRLGLRPILAGRNAEKVRALARSLDFSYRAVGLDDPHALDVVLREVDVVLNVAGPFSRTARPMADACLRNRVHYLDVTGELPVFRHLQGRDAEAMSRDVMIMPGVGFVIVPTDCLAAHVAGRVRRARCLRIGISRPDFISRGTATTMLTLVNDGTWVRRDGRLTTLPVGSLDRDFDFGAGPVRSTAVSLPDVYTAFFTTGVPDIEVFAEASGIERAGYRLASRFAGLFSAPPLQRLLEIQAKLLPEEPRGQSLESAVRVIVAEAETASGERVRSTLSTPDGYLFTPVSALAVVERVLAGESKPGFQTPAGVYGAEFVTSLEGVSREDRDPERPRG